MEKIEKEENRENMSACVCFFFLFGGGIKLHYSSPFTSPFMMNNVRETFSRTSIGIFFIDPYIKTVVELAGEEYQKLHENQLDLLILHSLFSMVFCHKFMAVFFTVKD